MVDSNKATTSLASIMETGGLFTTPLDAAAEYWRSRVDRLLPLYVWAMFPHAIVAGLLIAAIASEQRILANRYCMYFVAATLWRWVWLGYLQGMVQREISAQPRGAFWSLLPRMIFIRLIAVIGMTWGIVLAGVPFFYGLFLGSFAAPLVLEAKANTSSIGRGMTWIHQSAKRLLRICLAMAVITLVLLLAIFVSQYIFVRTFLPSMLGIDTVDLELTLRCGAWRLSVFYFVFLLIDAFWTVAAVLIYYDSQSRRTATDLQARLMVLTEGVA